MNCFSCDAPAVNACKRCSKTYCAEHGSDTYCADCLQPASAMPSFNLYRGALLVMLIGTAVAIFLLIRPPGETDSAPPVVVGRSTPTVTPVGGAEATQPAAASGTPGTPPQSDGTAAAATSTPGGQATASPTVDPDEVAFREYVVVEGDTLFGIAEQTIGPDDDIVLYVEAIANLNGWTVDTAELVPGDTILLPPLPE
jgi:hypothetical protein